EVVEKYLKKGQKVYIEGKLKTRSWEDKDGNKRYTTEVVADNMTMLSPKDGGESTVSDSPVAKEPDLAPATDDKTDDLPF
ncbi:single-stranded DNA-binding protein, partial [bacterium AH-315-M05]|nr:single-stranded DNA-binding protein [bacterium AH-315-M05]